jgi:hypothetical protein
MNFRAHRRLFAAWPLLCAVLSGCSLIPHQERELVTGSYHPENVFVSATTLPTYVKQVAILPLVCDQQDVELAAGRDTLEPILRSELAKTRKFQITVTDPELLRLRTGQDYWSDEDALPQSLFDSLRNDSGCDAVLFCRLTVYRGFAPLAVGCRMRLVNLRTQTTIWSVDEVIDAGHPAVLAGARRFQLAELDNSAASPDEWLISNSPRQFGQYAAAQLLATLPHR